MGKNPASISKEVPASLEKFKTDRKGSYLLQ